MIPNKTYHHRLSSWIISWNDDHDLCCLKKQWESDIDKNIGINDKNVLRIFFLFSSFNDFIWNSRTEFFSTLSVPVSGTLASCDSWSGNQWIPGKVTWQRQYPSKGQGSGRHMSGQ